MSRWLSLVAAFFLCVCPIIARAGSIQNLNHPAPEGIQIAFQMTDGTILGQSDNNVQHWYKLTPDNKGSYVNGTWARVADLPSNYAPLYFASQVLADGRLVIIGGEYSFGNFGFISLGAIYDPQANTWTALKRPKGKQWKFIGDSQSIVLPDGRFLLGDKFNESMAALDPKTLKWTALGSQGKADFNSEEGWILMPDGTILTYDVKDHPNSEIYDLTTQSWSSPGTTVVDLRGPQNCCGRCIHYGKNKCYDPPGEVGPAVLRPDGSVFAEGAIPDGQSTAHTAIFKNGAWSAGPDIPNNDDMGDTFSTLLPSGNVLMEGNSGHVYEFDGKTITQQSANVGVRTGFMLLPTGQVLIDGTGVYNSSGSPQKSWAPSITTAPSAVTRGSTYQISGTQFNGLSQANAFGDELETATNYPLVRITNNNTGHVFFARTHDHSTMAVATGKKTVSTNFDVAASTETGASSLVVIANGIASAPVSVTIN